MIGAYLAFHARRYPQSIATLRDGNATTYRQLEQDVARVAFGLRALGVEPRQRVALSVADLYTYFLLVLGFDRLGCAIASLGASQISPALVPAGDIDWCFTDFVPVASNLPRHHQVTSAWLQSLAAIRPADHGAIEEPADAPVHLRATSGTTGPPKRHEITRRMMLERIQARVWHYRLSPNSRYLVGMPLSVGSVYLNALTCVYAGATVVFESRPLIDSGTLSGITHVTLLPLHLRQLLDVLPARFVRPAQLTVVSIGARLPKALALRTLSWLASEVIDVYGTNETGSIAAMELEGPGRVLPGVEVRIVDDDGALLPLGREGQVAVRSPGMVHHYLDDPQATARDFREGWFLPGDLGVLHRVGELEIIGRGDELLNVGGQKLSPVDIEERLQQLTGANDVGVCSVVDADGIEQLAVALAGLPGDQAAAIEKIRAAVGDSYGKVLVIPLAAVPRTGEGKIRRSELKRISGVLLKEIEPRRA